MMQGSHSKNNLNDHGKCGVIGCTLKSKYKYDISNLEDGLEGYWMWIATTNSPRALVSEKTPKMHLSICKKHFMQTFSHLKLDADDYEDAAIPEKESNTEAEQNRTALATNNCDRPLHETVNKLNAVNAADKTKTFNSLCNDETDNIDRVSVDDEFILPREKEWSLSFNCVDDMIFCNDEYPDDNIDTNATANNILLKENNNSSNKNNTTEKITPPVIEITDSESDIEGISDNVLSDTVSTFCNFCRTCTKKILSDEFISLSLKNDNIEKTKFLRKMIKTCVPLINLDIIADPKVCSECYSLLHIAYAFVSRCLETEELYSKMLKQLIQKFLCDDGAIENDERAIVASLIIPSDDGGHKNTLNNHQNSKEKRKSGESVESCVNENTRNTKDISSVNNNNTLNTSEHCRTMRNKPVSN